MLAVWFRWLTAKVLAGSAPRLHVSNKVSLSQWLSFSEFWSFHEGIPAPERNFIRRSMAVNRFPSVAFDVGANIGLFSCFLASHPTTELHAFEPVPETFCRLKANLAANGLLRSCHLNCLAVGKANDLLTFRLEPTSPATNRLHFPDENSAAPSAPLQRVPSISLDNYCASVGVNKIDFLKVDVEGMEPWVLEGARDLLADKRVRAILLEICPANLRSVGLTTTALFRQFETLPYLPYALHPDGNLGKHLPLPEIESMRLSNIALLPRP